MEKLNQMIPNPEFIIYCGPMWSSKTSKLLMELERYRYQKKIIEAFKPKIDDRYDVNQIVTHGGWGIKATCVTNGSELLEYVARLENRPDVIAVDEAFMIPGISKTLSWLYKSGFSIIVSSLELSASGKPFDEITNIFPWATRIEKCTAVCTVCSRNARFTYKKSVNEDEIEVGGSELYEPRCFEHHMSFNNR